MTASTSSLFLQRQRSSEVSAPSTRSLSSGRPLGPARAWSPYPRYRGGESKRSRSREKARAHAEQRTPRKTSLPNKKGGGAPRGAQKGRIDKRCGAHPFSCPPLAEDRGRTGRLGPQKMERARSPFGAPPRHPRFLCLGSAQAALPGITGCKREDPLRHQCSEHLAVRHAPDGTMPKPPASAVYRCAHENRPRSASRSTLAKGVLRERDGGNVTVMGMKVKGNVALLGTRRRVGRISAA